jgi:para-nitrobenzyl esterase
MNKMLLSALVFMLIMAAAVPTSVSQIREAKVTGGEVKGSISDGVASFKGIPFAAPPVAELRWKAPQPVKPWTGVLKAHSFAPACMQIIDTPRFTLYPTEKVSEDCLYLNLWTAAKNENEKRPVMVWVHGGGFTRGMTKTPLFDGTKFAQKGVVFVSVAYRLGSFGFLAHPDLSRESGKGSGTYGLQDIIAALQWVKNNIAQFGGDPACVTILGQSAGGTIVSILAASPAAKGLFHRVIAESGASFAPPRFGREAGLTVPTLGFAESIGKNFLDKLRVADIKAARAISAQKIQDRSAAIPSGTFWPVADGEVLPGDQYELYLAERFNDTPILVGTNSDEGAAFARGLSSAKLFEQYVRNNFGPAAESILSVYPHANNSEAFQASRDIGRDNIFAWHTWTWARLQTLKGKNKAFVYYFDYHNAWSQAAGASHSAELAYVFGNFRQPNGALPPPEPGRKGRPIMDQSPIQAGSWGFADIGPSSVEKALSDTMSSYWINFAKSGDPNSPGLPEWPAFSGKQQAAMYFGPGSSSAKPLPNIEKLKVFDPYYARRRMEAKARAGNSNN